MADQQTQTPETPSILSRIWGWITSAASMAEPAWTWLSSRTYSFGEVALIVAASVVIARLF